MVVSVARDPNDQNIEGSYQGMRRWQEVNDLEKIDQFITEKLSRQISMLKGFDDANPRVKFLSKKPGFLYVVKLDNHLDFLSKYATLQTNLDRHIEMDFSILQSKDDLLLIQPVVLRLAETERRSPRITGLKGKVTATNFLVTKEILDDSRLYGVVSRVLIQDIHKKVMGEKQNSQVSFPEEKDWEKEKDLSFQSGKTIFILNTLQMISISYDSVLDAKKAFDEELILEERIMEYKKRKITSILVYPVVLPYGKRKPFAFLIATSNSNPLDPEILEKYKEIERIFLQRFLDSNTQTVDVRQNVINASLHGLALEITEPAIRKAIRIRPTMTIDLNFKMQQPLRVALDVKHIQDHGDYDIVGAEIAGFSGDPEGGSKYKSFLDFIQKI